MALSCWKATLVVLVVLAAAVAAQDDLADYPIKEEQCENFGECLTECVKKLPPNRQFTEILDCSDACAVTHCKEVIVEDPTLGIASQAPSFGGQKAPPSFGAPKVPQWGGQAGAANVQQPALDQNLLPDGGPNEMQRTNVGTMMFNPKDTMAGRSLDLYGEHFRDEHELLKQVVREGDIIVDAGAQYGNLALALAKVVGPSGAVHAFEPQRVLHQLLCSNFAMNQAFNCHCRQEALGGQGGEIVVPALDITKEGCHGCTALDASNYLGETVKMTTVDDLNLAKMRLLKVDVEGMEADVVRGAVKTINMFKPALYVRAHYDPADNTLSQKTQDVARFIQTLNYDMYWHFVRLYYDDNFYSNPNNVFGEETILFILAVPHVDGSSIEGLEPVVVPPA